ncbi:MAG: beta-galactosidase [Rhodospirillales bacterium]
MKKISLQVAGFAALALAGVTVLPGAADRPASFPMEIAKDDFAPNVLDASSLIEAPTGKHGFLTVKGDRFVFEDGTPIRFFGSQMNVPRKEQVDYTVRRMRRQGINITRLHGLEFLNDRNGKTSFDYNMEAWDRLDYLIYRLGQNGIYIILDVHYPLILQFKPGDNIPGLPKGGPAPYAQFINDKVASMIHQRMRDVFTHVNPYTKKRYADDPTLAAVEILNEDSLFWGTVQEPFRTELEQKFADWLRRKYEDNEGLERAWRVGGKSPLATGEGIGAGQRVALYPNSQFTERHLKEHPERRLRGQDQLRFYYELEEKYWSASREVMRKAGVKVPIAGTNWQGHGFPTRIHMLSMSKFDYIDRHGYWDHPSGEGDLKWRIATANFHNLPMVKAVHPTQDTLVYLGVGNLVTEKAWEQVLGRPMTISEWNTCLPNEFSLEGTALMTAYGLLQGWDGSMQFGYFSTDFRDSLGRGSFDLFGNPPQILQFPAAATMWHRQDVREAPLVAESLYDTESLFEWTEDRKPLPLAAALVGKVGYRFVQEPRKPVVQDISKYWDPEKLAARSITGELSWDARYGVVHINTPRSQVMVGFLSSQAHILNDVRLQCANRFGAVYVTAMSGLSPIRSARRLLVTAVGPARSPGMEYEQTERRGRLGPYWRLKSPGDGPAMLEAIVGDLRIRNNYAGKLKAWTLDVTGKRRAEVPLSVDGDSVVLKMQPEHRTVYYELAVE